MTTTRTPLAGKAGTTVGIAALALVGIITLSDDGVGPHDLPQGPVVCPGGWQDPQLSPKFGVAKNDDGKTCTQILLGTTGRNLAQVRIVRGEQRPEIVRCGDEALTFTYSVISPEVLRDWFKRCYADPSLGANAG